MRLRAQWNPASTDTDRLVKDELLYSHGQDPCTLGECGSTFVWRRLDTVRKIARYLTHPPMEPPCSLA
jgi:hypothetical protein